MKALDWFVGLRDAKVGNYNSPKEASRKVAYEAGYDASAAKAYALALA
jgi:hypothetical protein